MKRTVTVYYTIHKEVEIELDVDKMPLMSAYKAIKAKTGDDENVDICGIFDKETDECYYED